MVYLTVLQMAALTGDYLVLQKAEQRVEKKVATMADEMGILLVE